MRTKKYSFSFNGTIASFNEAVKSFQEGEYDPSADYICQFSKEIGQYSFGVLRGGHSGGYWYEPSYSEKDGELIIEGELRYIELNGSKTTILIWVTIVILSPLLLISLLVRGVVWIIRKMLGRPTIKAEEKALFNLMEKLGCVRKNGN